MADDLDRVTARAKHLLHGLALRFTQHEAWALKTARKVPLLSLFVFAPLLLWPLLPAMLIGLPLVVLLENTGPFGASVNFALGLAALAIMAPWVFRWYFVCAGVMFGRTRMAHTKHAEICARLKRLQG